MASTTRLRRLFALSFLSCTTALTAQGAYAASTCDLDNYKSVEGLAAVNDAGGVTLRWQGEAGAELRAQFALRDGQPVIRQLAAREKGGEWVELAADVIPDFQVTAGKRRISTAQLRALQRFHTDTPENIEKRKWDTFWDAPLEVPGGGPEVAGLPRLPSEIRRGSSVFQSRGCKVTSEGARMTVTFDGLTLGIFSGDLKFTVYKGSSLLRQEAVASTNEPSIAYVYKAGLKGFKIKPDSKLVWRDTARDWQKQEFGGAVNTDPVNLQARNRLEILDTGKGSLAVFPTPHQFFFARENEVNLGYVYYRKDSEGSFSLGVMQPEHGEGYRPWGVSDAVWKHRTEVSRYQTGNFVIYNAPPGSAQRMSVYYHLSAKSPEAAQKSILAYTHDDVFKPVPGFKVLSGHYHMNFNEMLTDRGSLDYQPSWVSVFRSIGINLLYLGDFHDDSHARDPGPLRLPEQKVYFEGAARVSDKDFLVMPAEEVNSYFGGHWYLMLPKPVYFTHPDKLEPGKPFIENDPKYGQVYNLGSAKDALKMIDQEGGVMWTAHPRTKSSEGYPDAYKDQDFFLSDRFIGASWEALPTDLSEKGLCEFRCFGTGDDMSNWAPKAKFMIAEGDTYMKEPADETYPQMSVNYLKLDHVPLFTESWKPVTEAMRAGDFFGTTGEILFHNWGVKGTGAKRSFTAQFEYTYPLDFAELVWSDGTKVEKKLVNLTDSTPFGTRTLDIPFDATGKKWVRLAVWDSAGNGAYVQPVNLP